MTLRLSVSHLWRKDCEVEEEANIALVKRKGAKLGDGTDWGESFIDGNHLMH